MLYKVETDMIIGWAIEVHKNLGPGFLEIVYKDGLEYEVGTREMLYCREKMYKIKYKDIYLPHHFYADFVFFDKIIVEVKAKQGGIANEDLAQTINYLKVSGCKVGLIFNFAKTKLEIRRVVFRVGFAKIILPRKYVEKEEIATETQKRGRKICHKKYNYE